MMSTAPVDCMASLTGISAAIMTSSGHSITS